MQKVASSGSSTVLASFTDPVVIKLGAFAAVTPKVFVGNSRPAVRDKFEGAVVHGLDFGNEDVRLDAGQQHLCRVAEVQKQEKVRTGGNLRRGHRVLGARREAEIVPRGVCEVEVQVAQVRVRERQGARILDHPVARWCGCPPGRPSRRRRFRAGSR